MVFRTSAKKRKKVSKILIKDTSTRHASARRRESGVHAQALRIRYDPAWTEIHLEVHFVPFEEAILVGETPTGRSPPSIHPHWISSHLSLSIPLLCQDEKRVGGWVDEAVSEATRKEWPRIGGWGNN